MAVTGKASHSVLICPSATSDYRRAKLEQERRVVRDASGTLDVGILTRHQSLTESLRYECVVDAEAVQVGAAASAVPRECTQARVE